MYNNPTMNYDRGQFLGDRSVVERKSLAERNAALEAQVAEQAAQIATLKLHVQRIERHLLMATS